MPFREHRYFVYIIANATRILYTGFTSKLRSRVWKHKTKTFDGFTSHFHVCRLVYFESFDDMRRAIGREKQSAGVEKRRSS
jgi:putative endonuclease